MLWLLRASGVTMAIATTKDDVFAREIALNADFLPYLAAVIGSDREGTMLRKPELIAAALSALQVPHISPHSGESMPRTPNGAGIHRVLLTPTHRHGRRPRPGHPGRKSQQHSLHSSNLRLRQTVMN